VLVNQAGQRDKDAKRNMKKEKDKRQKQAQFNELDLQHKTKYKRSQIAFTVILFALSLTPPGNKLLQHSVYSLIGSPGTWRC